MRIILSFALLFATPVAAQTPALPDAAVRQLFEAHAREQHMPGLAYGVVKDGKLVLTGGIGVRDTATKAPVDADTRFRIASMSKAFTALAILLLRDEGKLRLDDLAEVHVPQMRTWKYPTVDAPRIRVRDLLTHTAGFVDDNPWGDRQQPLPEAEFTRMLAAGVPFSRVPQEAMEYSNFGYATLGRIITNVSGMPYQRFITDRLLRPLGMTSTGFDVFASPAASRALGYRWEEAKWKREPDMADGAFGAMGGMETTANDYARYVAWLLSAWPSRDEAETGPMKRSTMREIVQGSNFATLGERRTGLGAGSCLQSVAYGMGWRVISDCALRYVTHTGGYPGYGSVVMLMPEAGVGVFAFSNRTYGAPVPPTYQALKLLKDAGLAAERPVAMSARVTAGYAAAQAIWAAGAVDAQRERLAMNFLMDRSAVGWRAELARLKAATGACRTDAPITPTTAMAGRFSWECDNGRVTGSILLAPTATPQLQELRFAVAPR
jgi:CubicO group peptidase (beta-lactamase class C family)